MVKIAVVEDVNPESRLNPKQRFIISSIKHDPSDMSGKRRRRGLKRGRPKSVRKKPPNRACSLVTKPDTRQHIEWFVEYWNKWFEDPENYFKPWPLDVIKGSINAITSQDDIVFYFWIICNNKDGKHVSNVCTKEKKITESLKINITNSTLLVLARFNSSQIEAMNNMVLKCRKAKKLSGKILMAIQYAVETIGVELFIDESIFDPESMFYSKEVVNILSQALHQVKKSPIDSN